MTCSSLHFLESEFVPAPPADAAFHIIPTPYERSVSYGQGTANGPQAILAASQQLEAIIQGECPGNGGLHTQQEIVCDAPPETVMDRIGNAVSSALDVGALPVLLGGEHTVSYGAIRAVAQRYAPLGIIHIDAHADLRDHYQNSRWSHACVMRRVLELNLPILQIGVRSLAPEEVSIRQANPVFSLDAYDLYSGKNLSSVIPAEFPEHVYLSVDLDGLDASIMPATGTPEPGGLQFWQTLDLVTEACQGRRITGIDVVELAPNPAHVHADYTAAKLTYALMAIARPQTSAITPPRCLSTKTA